MVIFNTDLDNTLIYSCRHDIGEKKQCVEKYQGRALSFMTDTTISLLQSLKEQCLIVPTTTRTAEQYQRIDLNMGSIPYALVCNGGVLLVNGSEDEAWYQETLKIISGCSEELEYAGNLLENDPNRNFDLRFVRRLFWFTKSSNPEASAYYLKERLDLTKVDVFCNGVKVYAVPKKNDKGTAARRLKEKLSADKMIAAGDSLFDIPMLQAADISIYPKTLAMQAVRGQKCYEIGEGVFSEKMLSLILELSEAGSILG